MLNKRLLASVMVSTVIASPMVAFAATTTTTTGTITMSQDQQKQVEMVVHNYLVKNPEVLVEALQTLQQKQMDQQRKTMMQTQDNAPKFVDGLFHASADPVAGNSNGKITVVDFFDYQCPHCVKMTPVLEGIIKANPNVRVVFKEFPIRGPISEFASRVALAAKNQGKYFEFHKALMKLSSTTPTLTEDSVLQVAKSVGLNMDQLKADMKADAVNQQIKDNYKLAQGLQLIGTPAFFIAKSDVTKDAKPTAIVFIPGQVDQAQLQTVIEKIGK